MTFTSWFAIVLIAASIGALIVGRRFITWGLKDEDGNYIASGDDPIPTKKGRKSEGSADR